MSKKQIVTIKFEIPESDVLDLENLERDGALEDLAEVLATLEGRRVVAVDLSA